MSAVCLAGGTGGAKLAAGLQELVGADLSVIANTGDDTEVHGLLVCPDPDLCTYWLAGQIDEERGWGIRDDTFTVHERLEQLGAPGWFSLSDRDLATCLYRTHFIAEGGTLTAAQAQIGRALGNRAAVLPMSEQPVRTRVQTPAGWRGLQEFLILDHAEAPIVGVELEGIAEARPTPEVLEALAERRGGHHRPVQPRDLDRPDPLRTRDARGDRGRAGPRRGGEPAGRRARGQGPDRRLPRARLAAR